MDTSFPPIIFIALFAALFVGITGCGTAKLTNTSRTATEQMLLSDAMDRAVSQVNFSMLSGRKVFINDKPIAKVTDSDYLLSIVRQHALASGCLLQEKEEEAEVILELRAGTSGTDQNDTMLGISEMTIPGFGTYSSTTIPEIAMAKRTIQKATVKIGIFAYTRVGRRPVWQSGNLVAESKAKNRWVFGMGPYQTGDIYDSARLGGAKVEIPLIDTESRPEEKEFISVGSQAFFRQNFAEEEKAITEAEAAKEKEEAAKKDSSEKKDAIPDSPVPQAVPSVSTAAVGTQIALPPPPPGTYSALAPVPIN